MPPEWMWTFNDELEEWFEDVEAHRRNGTAGRRAELEDAPDMMQNELTRGRRR